MARKKVGEVRNIAEAVKQMDPTFTHCRDYGHAWEPFRGGRVPGGWERQLRCTRCHTVRKQFIGVRRGTTEIDSNRYVQPEGYRVKGLGRITGDDRGKVRMASILDDVANGRFGNG